MKPAIEIVRTDQNNEKSWRAVVRLPKCVDWKGVSVMGVLTEQGPWVDGYGYTPDQAVAEAMRAIGRAVVSMCEHVPDDPKVEGA